MTVVGRKRGEKGFRLLQGDYLINMFLELNQKQVNNIQFSLLSLYFKIFSSSKLKVHRSIS